MENIEIQTGSLQLCPININKDYRKKWNEISQDFVLLTLDGKPVSETLYRLGGMSNVKINENIDKKYILILKYVESIYDGSIYCKTENDKRYLASKWCIVDKFGTEKVVFDSYRSPYLHGDIIYSENSKFYNIETRELYCSSTKHMSSDGHLFLDNSYDVNMSRRGIMKIDKCTGLYEIYP